MAPTILIVGATGNTGRSVVETLSKLSKTSKAFSEHRLLALTRSSNSVSAQQLAKLPGVEVLEYNWVEITSDWLLENEVVRAFIASPVIPTQFSEESNFHVNALIAGVKYVVRISTTGPNVHPSSRAFYARTHWAIETMLSSPEFDGLQWTSLQPNGFTPLILYTAVEFINQFRKTGKQGTLGLVMSENAPVGIIDPDEIGVVAALLLLLEDPTVHNKAKYILNGPEDISGAQIVKLVEQYIGEKVKDVKFKDLSFVDYMAATQPQYSKNIISSIKYSVVVNWDGLCKASTTSKEILELAAPKRTPADVLKTILGE